MPVVVVPVLMVPVLMVPVMVDANADEHVDAVKNPPVKSALNQVSVRELAQTKARLVDE